MHHMSKEKEVSFVYFEARPKRGNTIIVDKKIYEMMDLFAEIFDRNRRNCNFRPLQSGNFWTVQATFEDDEARDLLVGDPRFQEIMTDLRVYCKPAHRLKRLLYPIIHPGRQFAGILRGPIGFPD